MATRDLGDLFADGTLTYPGVPSAKHPKGKTYSVPSPSARVGLFLTQLADEGVTSVVNRGGASDKLKLDDDEERDFLPLVLGCTEECGRLLNGQAITDADNDVTVKTEYAPKCGSAFDQMVADDVQWHAIQVIGQDAFLCFGINKEFADAMHALDRTSQDLADAGDEGKAEAPTNRTARRTAERAKPKKAAKKASSAPKAGSSSNRASGAASTPTSLASTPGPDGSDHLEPEAQAV